MATRSPHLQEPHQASYLQDQPKSCKHPSSHPDVEEAPGADAENLCHGSEPHGGHGGRIRTEHLFGVNSNSCRKRGNQCQNQPIGGTKPEDRTRYSHSDAFSATFGSFQYSIQLASVPGSRPPRPAPSLASRTTSGRHRCRFMPTALGAPPNLGSCCVNTLSGGRSPRSSTALRALLHPGRPVDTSCWTSCSATGGDLLGGRTAGTASWTCRSRRTMAVCARGTPPSSWVSCTELPLNKGRTMQRHLETDGAIGLPRYRIGRQPWILASALP